MAVYGTRIFINNLHNTAGSRRPEDAACFSKCDIIPVIKRQFSSYLFLVYECAVKASKISDYETLFEFECNKAVYGGNAGIEYGDMIIGLAADDAVLVNFSLISAASGEYNKLWHYPIFRRLKIVILWNGQATPGSLRHHRQVQQKNFLC